jgi:SNF2 family DNA or RNA helicase
MDSDGEFGGNYQTIIDWNDDVNKCASCSNLVDHRHHDEFFKNIFGKMEYNGVYHPFKPSINEVAKMKDRMEGIVLVVNKEDVCDLPDKIMEQVRVQPSTHQLELAQMLTQYAAGAEAMIRLRCLSDGFQYVDQETGSSKVCSQCNGDEVILHGYEDDKAIYGTCGACDGTGVQLEVKRIGQATDICPKDDYIKAVLEEQEEQGRIVIWGAFKWTIDHIIELCHGEGWGTIRVDGRGREARDHLNNVIDCDEVLRSFDNGDPDLIQMMRKHPKVAFVGNPGAGGMGLTLHTAKKAVYYSNTFHGESRIQSVDRIHRIGMNDLPATIVDLICLPVDLYVLQNLGKKATLENLTMHRVREALELDISNIPLFQ